jgi:hypothetical protein
MKIVDIPKRFTNSPPIKQGNHSHQTTAMAPSTTPIQPKRLSYAPIHRSQSAIDFVDDDSESQFPRVESDAVLCKSHGGGGVDPDGLELHPRRNSNQPTDADDGDTFDDSPSPRRHSNLSAKALAYLRDRTSSKEIKISRDERFRHQELPMLCRRCPNAYSRLAKMLTTNLIEDGALLRLYRRMCCEGHVHHQRVLQGREGVEEEGVHEHESNVDDGGVILVRLAKFWAISLLGIVAVHSLAKWVVSSLNT